jgi:hypothetical protein
VANEPKGFNVQQGLSIVEEVDRLITDSREVFSDLKKFLRKRRGVIGLVLIVTATFTLGGLTWNYVQPRPDPSMAAVVSVAATVPDVGVLDGVTITNIWIKQAPGQTYQEYIIGVTFPTPDTCDSSCSAALADVLGPHLSCEGQVCSAELSDMDEGLKNNSSDIYEQCDLYWTGGQKVLVMFSGARNQDTSDYANILLVKPSAR